jgi:hypothetical protein
MPLVAVVEVATTSEVVEEARCSARRRARQKLGRWWMFELPRAGWVRSRVMGRKHRARRWCRAHHVKCVPRPGAHQHWTCAGNPRHSLLGFTRSNRRCPLSMDAHLGNAPGWRQLEQAGTISGTPAAPGTSEFTVQVTDTNGSVASTPLSLTVQPNAAAAPAPAPLSPPIVRMAAVQGGGGYWTVASSGAVRTGGNAGFYGSATSIHLSEPIVGMAPTHDDAGYWLAASDGGVFAYGDAAFHGSTGGASLNAPIVGMAATGYGNGYWLVAVDGGIFAYGDAVFYGSQGGRALHRPIVRKAGTTTGYWLVASDGGVFS